MNLEVLGLIHRWVKHSSKQKTLSTLDSPLFNLEVLGLIHMWVEDFFK